MSAPETPKSNRAALIVGVVVALAVLGIVGGTCVGMAYMVVSAVRQMQREVDKQLEQARSADQDAEKAADTQRQQRRQEAEEGEKLAQTFLDHLRLGRFSEARACGSTNYVAGQTVASLKKLVEDWPVLRAGMKPGPQPPFNPTDQGPLKYVFVAKAFQEGEPRTEAEIVVRKEGEQLKIDQVKLTRE